MEPTATTSLLISKINNAMEVVKSWRESRDRKITLDLLNKSRSQEKTNHSMAGYTLGLTLAIGQETLKDAVQRIDECVACYEIVLTANEFFPGEIEKAEKSLIACIGKQLERLEGMDKESAEGIIKNYWMDYISKEP